MNSQQIVQQYWDSYVGGYAAIHQNLVIYGMSLLNMLQIREAKDILEAGCGTGYIIPYLLSIKSSQATLTSVDIAPEMIRYAKQYVYSHLTNHQSEYNEQLAFQLFSKENWSVGTADVENLSEFKDGTFDTYLSSLVLHITSNPESALKEAHRVLRKGGKIGFSVWGRRQNSDYMTVLKKALTDVGYVVRQEHDLFTFGEDIQRVKQQLQSVGFKNILMWYQQSPFDAMNSQEYMKGQNPKLLELIHSQPELEGKFYERFDDYFKDKLENQNEPFFLENLLVIAEKE